jgi:hypothetical protein
MKVIKDDIIKGKILVYLRLNRKALEYIKNITIFLSKT